jgi:predicted amidophosphoribosyltransferase
VALIKCVDCGKDVSSNAGRCPHCGSDFPKSATAGVVFRWAMLAMVIIPVLLALFAALL